MEYLTFNLHFLGINIRLKVYRENTSDMWVIPRYTSHLLSDRTSQNTNHEIMLFHVWTEFYTCSRKSNGTYM